MIFDSHVHLWERARGDYHWLTPALPSLYRDFGIDDFADASRGCGVGGAILVQAAETSAETLYLLGLAEQMAIPAGVVGWIDFFGPDPVGAVAAFAAHPHARGIRPMLQDQADASWIGGGRHDATFAAMVQHRLTFDALIRPHQLCIIDRLAARHPALTIVIDHAAKPNIAADEWQPWREAMTQCARHDSVACKLSGLLTEALPGAGVNALRPYVKHVAKLFGPHRLMWGSDWPLLLLNGDYPGWLSIARTLVQDCGMDADAVFHRNARAAYRLDVLPGIVS